MSKCKVQAVATIIALCTLMIDICAAKPPAAAPAPKHDKGAPIEITSDTLEVFQAENRAVFSGNVVAVQAEDRLKADVMTVYYRKQDDADQPKPKADKKTESAAKSPEEAGAIKKIDADGHVFLSTPTETASGVHGIYDVEQHTIYLNDHVVLTRGKNVLKGDKLTYNLDTGKSVVTSAAGVETPGNTPDGKKERVRALFIPDNKGKPDDKGKTAPAPANPAANAAPAPAAVPATPIPDSGAKP